MATHLCLLVSIGREPEPGLCRGLAAADFRSCVASSIGEAATAVRQWACDVALLVRDDHHQPGVQTGELRSCCAAPIVVATCRMDEASQLQELDAGAAGVIDARESPRLVGAKLRQLVAAMAVPPPERTALRVGSLQLDLDGLSAVVGEQPLALTSSEFLILWGLAVRLGDVVTREVLLRCLHPHARPGRRSVDTHVYRIRRQLERACALDLRIESIHGRGYRMSRTVSRIDQQVIQRSAAVFQTETVPFGRHRRVGLGGDLIQSPLSR